LTFKEYLVIIKSIKEYLEKYMEVLKMKTTTIKSNYFCGNEVSEYGKKSGYVDYRTLAKCFDAVLCNDITKLFYSDINGEYNEPELYNGSDYNEEEDYYYDIFQYYIISSCGAEILERYTDEIVYYIPVLDIYVWGVTHFGTSWDYVLTDIKIEEGDKQ
jgi:hypothetical protein